LGGDIVKVALSLCDRRAECFIDVVGNLAFLSQSDRATFTQEDSILSLISGIRQSGSMMWSVALISTAH
jgi:hypothetical protein